jgi:hypothetical protein
LHRIIASGEAGTNLNELGSYGARPTKETLLLWVEAGLVVRNEVVRDKLPKLVRYVATDKARRLLRVDVESLANLGTSIEAVATVPEVEWDGVWDLDRDEEMRAMLKTLMQAHEAVLMRVQDDWQMGWKGKGFEVWGLRLPCPRRAIRDASERLFKKIKGKDVVNGDYPPNPLLHWVRSENLREKVKGLEDKVEAAKQLTEEDDEKL